MKSAVVARGSRGRCARARVRRGQQRVASKPIYWIAGGIVGAVAAAALWASLRGGDGQLVRELLLPLLSFAGGLGIGKAASANK